MATVPAVRSATRAARGGGRGAVAAVGALATVGFEPAISLPRFEYITLALWRWSVALGLVYRLGRGSARPRPARPLTVRGQPAAGADPGVRRAAAPVRHPRAWSSGSSTGSAGRASNLGAFPRPIEAVLGIPALTWGIHMRARRRQGWWVCAFGVAATAPIAHALLNTSVTRTESSLAVLYAVVVGLAVGFLLIRVDLLLSGTGRRRGSRAQADGAGRSHRAPGRCSRPGPRPTAGGPVPGTRR